MTQVRWLEYRVPISAFLLVASLGSMFVLTSQSGSSFATYILALFTFAGFRRWVGLWTDWLFLASVGLSGLVAASSLWSDPFDARAALSQAIRALLVVAFIVAIAEGFRVDWFRRGLTGCVAVLSGAAAIAAICVFLLDPPLDGRLKGLGQLDVHVRAALVFGAALVCALAWAVETQRLGLRVLAYGIALVLGIAVFLSGSRNAWVAVPFGAAVFMLAHMTSSRRTFLMAALGLGAVFVLALLVVVNQPELRSLALPRGDSFRLAIWGETVERWWNGGVWFGLGILTPDDVTVEPWVMPHAHNVYLAVLYQVGLTGLSLFLVLLAWTIASLMRAFDDSEAKLAIGILAIALPSYVLDGYQVIDKIGWTWLLLWLPVAIAIGLRARHSLQDAQRFGGS